MLDPFVSDLLLTVLLLLGALAALAVLVWMTQHPEPSLRLPCPRCGVTIRWAGRLADLPPCPCCGWQGRFPEPKEVCHE